MKRYLIATAVVLMILAIAWPVLAQREGREAREGQRRFQDMSEEERAKMRERFQNMSEEERAKMRERFAGRGPMLGREAQLKAIEEIEKQLANLKEIVRKGPERESLRKLREASPEEQAKLRESLLKGRQEQQKLVQGIQEQLARLGGQRPPTTRPGLPIKELQGIHKLAVKENAKGTSERLEKLITSLQKGPQDQRQERGQRPQRQRPPRERPEK